jgi:hypothetical protein
VHVQCWQLGGGGQLAPSGGAGSYCVPQADPAQCHVGAHNAPHAEKAMLPPLMCAGGSSAVGCDNVQAQDDEEICSQIKPAACSDAAAAGVCASPAAQRLEACNAEKLQWRPQCAAWQQPVQFAKQQLRVYLGVTSSD